MKDALYFSHDTNAFTDPKIISLIMKYSFRGYGVRWFLLEQLAQSSGYKYKIEDVAKLAFIARLEIDDLTDMIAYMIEHELLVNDGVHFWSPSLKRRMEMKDAKKRARANAGKKGGIASAETRNAQNAQEEKTSEEATIKGMQEVASSKNEAMLQQTSTNATANVQQKGSKKERKKERKKENNSANAPDGAPVKMSKNEQLFMQFREHYPLKKNKKASMQKFVAAMKKQGDPAVFVQKCIDAVKQQSTEKDVLAAKGKFVPDRKLPTTRINNECRDDEVQFKSVVTAKLQEKPPQKEQKEEKKIILSAEQKAVIKTKLGGIRGHAVDKFTS